MTNGFKHCYPCTWVVWYWEVLKSWHLLLFLASPASTFLLQNDILAGSKLSFEDKYTIYTTLSWKSLSNAEIPPEPANWFQKVWGTVTPTAVYDDILTRCSGDADQARLKAVNSPHAGDLLNALPIASVGLRLSDEEIRVAVGYHLGSSICQPHQCVCGSFVDARGIHTACLAERVRHGMRHSLINDILWRTIKKAQVLACKEPVGLSRSDDKRPDGATLISSSHGKSLSWNVTVPDTFCKSHITWTASNAGAAVDMTR